MIYFGANKINLKRTLTNQIISDFLGAPCHPIGFVRGVFLPLPPFLPIFFSLYFLEKRRGTLRAPPEARTL